MFPASGAWQLKTKCPNGQRPSSSLTSACSMKLSPMPPYFFGICGAQSPSSLTRSRLFRSSGSTLLKDFSPGASSGYTSRWTNCRIVPSNSRILSGTENSMRSSRFIKQSD